MHQEILACDDLLSHTSALVLLPARALMRERSKRRAELFSLSQSSASQRLLTPSLYCCWISMCSNSAATDVILTSPRLLLLRRRLLRVLPPAACCRERRDPQTLALRPALTGRPTSSSTSCGDTKRGGVSEDTLGVTFLSSPTDVLQSPVLLKQHVSSAATLDSLEPQDSFTSSTFQTGSAAQSASQKRANNNREGKCDNKEGENRDRMSKIM